MADEQRFVLSVAYQAGRDPRIRKGQDGGRDCFTPEQLEKAAWSFMRNGPKGGTFHVDGTVGAITYTESSIYRGPDWVVTGPDGRTTVVKAGDWIVGGVLDPAAWDLYKRGLITGVSPQGTARRIASRSGG